MADSKDYVTRDADNGRINISEEVIATIASAAAAETEGVGGFSTTWSKELGDRLGVKKNVTRGTKIEVTENCVSADIYILVKYGSSVTDTAKAVQNAVKNSVEAMTGLEVTAVNVHVCGVAFDKDR